MSTCCSQQGSNGTVFVHDECYAWCEFGHDSSFEAVSDGFYDCLKQAFNDSVGSFLKDGDVAVGPFSCGVGGSRQSVDGSNDDDDGNDGGDEAAGDELGGRLAYGVPDVKVMVGVVGCGVLVLSGCLFRWCWSGVREMCSLVVDSWLLARSGKIVSFYSIFQVINYKSDNTVIDVE